MAHKLKKKTFNTTPRKYVDLGGISKEEQTVRIHKLVKNGELNTIPYKYLTTSYLTKFIPGEEKTAFHYAVEGAGFYLLPLSVLTPKNLLLKDNNGECVCDTLLESGSTTLIPNSYFTPENLGIKHGLSSKKLLRLIKRDQLRRLPKKMFSKTLLKMQLDDYNLLENACLYCALEHIPKRLLTTKVLHKKYNAQQTAFELAVAHGNLAAIPHDVLMSRCVTLDHKMDILHEVTHNGIPFNLPVGFIDTPLIKTANKKGISVASIIAAHGMDIALKLIPPGEIDIKHIPELARWAIENGNQKIGDANLWYSHIGKATNRELQWLKDQFPIKEAFAPIIETILKVRSAGNQLKEAINKNVEIANCPT